MHPVIQALAVSALMVTYTVGAKAQPPPIIEHFGFPPACATQELVVSFAPGAQDLTAEAFQTLTSDLDRARPCNVWRVFVAGRNGGQSAAVVDALASQGLLREHVEIVPADVQVGPWSRDADRVRVTIVSR